MIGVLAGWVLVFSLVASPLVLLGALAQTAAERAGAIPELWLLPAAAAAMAAMCFAILVGGGADHRA